MRDHPSLNTLTRQRVGKEIVSAAIQFAGADDIVANLANTLDCIRNCGHSRRNTEGADTSFHRSDSLFQHIRCRIHDSGVDIARHFQVK